MKEEILYKVFQVPLSDKDYREKIKAIVREYLFNNEIYDFKILMSNIMSETKGILNPKFVEYIVNKYLRIKKENLNENSAIK